jgi:S1-C subfamily serine protease
VLLASLERSSRLAYEGLRPGDVITAVNQERVANLVGFRQALRRARGPLLLQLRRDGEAYVARID